MSLKRRIQKLAGGRGRYTPETCPAPQQIFLRYRRGEPEPPIPPDAPRCHLCGSTHVSVLEEVIVTRRAEAMERLAVMQGEQGRAVL
jgi:hypothetical protein